jgi:TRAP-type uncharacterized transport system substrate-binding protein
MHGGSPFRDWYIQVARRITEEQSNAVRIDTQAGEVPEMLAQLAQSPDQLPRMMLTLSEAEFAFKPIGLWPPQGVYNPPGRFLAVISIYPASQRVLTTIKPEYKTIHDLQGKRVRNNNSPLDVNFPLWQAIFREAGVNVEWLHLGGAESIAAMQAGTLDAKTGGLIYESAFAPPDVELARQTRRLRFVHVPPEIIDAVRAKNPGWDFLRPVRIQNAAVKNVHKFDFDITPPEVNNGEYVVNPSGFSNVWHIHESANEAVVYELTKTMLQNLHYFEGVYSGPYELYKQRVGHLYIPQSGFHPGARRAYDELGITYGLEGIADWEASRANR